MHWFQRTKLRLGRWFLGPVFYGLFIWSISGFSQSADEKKQFEYGEKLYAQNLFNLAEIQFADFIRSYPLSPQVSEAQYFVGECYYNQGKFDDGLRAYTQLLVRYPVSNRVAESQFRIAQCFENSGQIQEAILSYSRVFDFYPRHPLALESLYQAGRLSALEGELHRAESIFRKLVDQAPPGPIRWKAAAGLSDVFLQLNDLQRALLVLHPFLEGDQDEAMWAEAHLRTARIYEALGRWDDAEADYRKITGSSAGNSSKQEAWFLLGRRLELDGDQASAFQAYSQATRIETSAGWSIRAFYRQGRLLVREDRFKEALDTFDSGLALKPGPDLRYTLTYEKAACLHALGQFDLSRQVYIALRDDASAPPAIVKRSLLALARLNLESRKVSEALSSYEMVISRYPDDLMIPYVLLHTGRIYADSLGLLDEGRFHLRRLWVEYSDSRQAPVARWVYARNLERLGRYREALQIYDVIGKTYPGSQWVELAQDKMEKIPRLYPVDGVSGLARYTEMLLGFLTGKEPEPGLVFRLARTAFTELKQHEEAIRLSRLCLETPDGTPTDEVLFLLAQSYEAVAEKKGSEVYRDSAVSNYRLIMLEHPQSPHVVVSGLCLAELDALSTPDNGYGTYARLLRTYPNTEMTDELLYQLARTAQERDSLDRSVTIHKRLLQLFPKTARAEKALMGWALAEMDLGRMERADSLYRTVISRFPRGASVSEATFFHAMHTLRTGSETEGLNMLEVLRARFPQSVWADTALITLGEHYLENQNYQGAAHLFEEALKEDSLCTQAFELGLGEASRKNRNRILDGLARAYRGLRRYTDARNSLLQFGRRLTKARDRFHLYARLSQIAEEQGYPTLALEYLEKVYESDPSDSVSQVLGDLYFHRSDYAQAYTTYEKGLQHAGTKQSQALLSAGMIRALLNQDRIPQAEVRMRVFEQTYQSDALFEDYQAEFLLEKGMAYHRDKEFPLALESFEEVVRKYRRTRFVPRARLEMGKAYLVTNRVEEALDVLTGMVQEYPEDPILAQVYLNLGDHYFRSQQYDNAINALKYVLEKGNDPVMVPVAMRLLIRVYDSIRMWDSALFVLRDYVERFPDAEDQLQKRVQIGLFYAKMNDYSRAIEELREVKMTADPETEAEIQYWIGDAFFNMGRFRQSIFEFLKVEYLSKPTKLPWNTTALYKAAQAYLKLEELENAKKLFEKVVQKEGAASDMGRIARQRIQEIDAVLSPT